MQENGGTGVDNVCRACFRSVPHPAVLQDTVLLREASLSQQRTSVFGLLRRWIIQRVLNISSRRGHGLIDVADLPASLTMPLRRDGLDPVALPATAHGGDDIRSIGHILGMKVWLVTDYDQARAVLADPTYSTDIRSLVGGNGAQSLIGGLGFTDPPDHTALRKILMPEFTARRLSALQPAVERIVEQQLDLMQAAGPVADIVESLAFPVPFQVICELLGLPAKDRDRFRRLGHDRFDVQKGGAGIFGAISESREFMREAVSSQRRSPGTGLIASMLASHGDQVDDDTIAGLADGVFTGGYETSASMLALGTLALLRDDDARSRLQFDDSAVNPTVDELLRYLSVVQIAFPRFAPHDMYVSGQRVRAGDVVICSLSRANRGDVFGAAPNRFDPTRANHAHLAFGHGFHRCVGAELARMQLRVTFRALVRRFPTMALAVPAHELRFHDLSIVHGLTALPVHLHAQVPCHPAPPTR
jgi:cytochrome P450